MSAPAPAPADTIPLVPDSAPFTPAQRAWLNGFFAGLLGIEKAGGAIGANGNGATPAAEVEEDFPWHDPAMPMEDRLKLAEGKPLNRLMMASMAQLDCGACGYLCKSYAEAIATGEEKSLTKCVPGGGQTARKLKELLKNATLTPAGVSAPAKEEKKEAAKHTEHTARFMFAKPLNAPGSGKDTRWVSIDLAGSGVVYQTGDSLGVHVENDPELVRDVVAAFGAKGTEEVKIADDKFVLSEALLKKCDIVQASPDLLELLTTSAKNAEESAALKALSENGTLPKGFDKDPHVIDLLTHFPSARPSIEAFVTALSPLRPRLYSISSSPKAHPAEVHLTIAAVRYEMAGRKRKGVASTYFADRLESGREVKVFVHNSPHFRLPKDPNTPVIMCGPGTGIAPFRAFLQEREATNSKGRNWLFFGDQHAATDYLFREELEAWHKTGFLSRLDLAFSRDQQEKIYVQTRMKEKGEELWQWLNSGAYFYICGDAKKMARDVDQALHQIAAKYGNMSEADAKAFIAKLVKDGRYCKDVY
jgi:sulfite reductase (NADPH) flavoprotein alpha-component